MAARRRDNRDDGIHARHASRATGLFLIAVFLCLAVPICAYAAVVQEEESVEPPDEGDDEVQTPKDAGVETPKNAPLPEAEPAPRPSAPLPSARAPAGEEGFSTVILRGLNKVTARAQTIEAPLGSVVRFGTIEIVAHRCWQAAPEERPENAALLEISEVKQGEPPARIFLGWMFSSSPALSALENPFYDVTVVRCSKEGVKG